MRHSRRTARRVEVGIGDQSARLLVGVLLYRLALLCGLVLAGAFLYPSAETGALAEPERSAPAETGPVIISAAASTAQPLEEVIAAYGGDVVAVFGASGALARQIEAGAPADLFLSANPRWMDHLVDGGDVDVDAPSTLFSNRLVLIGPSGSAPLPLTPEAFAERLDGGRLAMGDPSAAPVGRYGQEALRHHGLWSIAEAALAPMRDTTTATTFVARGEATLGLVYASDAEGAAGVAVVAELPPGGHAPIRYLAAPIVPAENAAATDAFLAFLKGPEASEIFAAHGFTPGVEVTAERAIAQVATERAQ